MYYVCEGRRAAQSKFKRKEKKDKCLIPYIPVAKLDRIFWTWDTEIKNRVHLIADIFKVDGDLDTLDFAQRRKVIELFDVTGVIGLKDGRPYAEIIWCGESQGNMWLDTDESNEQGVVPEESRTS